jgi:hypothetical protein
MSMGRTRRGKEADQRDQDRNEGRRFPSYFAECGHRSYGRVEFRTIQAPVDFFADDVRDGLPRAATGFLTRLPWDGYGTLQKTQNA